MLSVIPVLPVAADTGAATDTPVISLDRTVAAQTLFGTAVAVTLTAKHVSGQDGYNLSFRDVLPAGATLAGGDAPTQKIAQGDGTTVLIWSNQSDLLAGTTSAISYSYSYPTIGAAPYVEGASLSSTANAYVNKDARTIPSFDSTGTVSSGTYTGTAASTSTTQLVPYTVTKKLLDAPENEMLRGVHDHKYVYRVTITNNTSTQTTVPVLTDYLPADLEFLGCSNIDNSATGTEEYTGAGRISDTGFPTLTNCAPGGVQPVATTITGDPDGTGQLPTGVYTKVVWSGISALAANAIVTIDYAVAVPLRENVASTGDGTANLDNNTGALTTDEEPVVNWAAVAATNGGTAYTVGAYETATAEDVATQKTVDKGTIVQGQTSTWTLNIQSSEYALSTTGTIGVTDVMPAGLDFAASTPATTGQTSNADGTITLAWTIPAFTAKNSTSQIVYTTTTRSTYRGSTNPVAAEDSWTNKVALTSTAHVRTGATSLADVTANDASSASQQAGNITIDKKVLPASVARPADCTGVATGSFVDDQSAAADDPFHPGDTVCWLLTVNFPGQLNTINSRIKDVLPTGFVYSSYYATGANNVTITNPPPAADAGSGTSESWSVDNAAGGNTFQVVVASSIASATGSSAAGTVQGNLMKVRFANTAGAVFQLRDLSNVKVSNPLLTPQKIASPTTGSAGTSVSFTVNVVNTGTQDTTARIVDALPTGFDCSSVVVPSGATCSGSTLTWASVAVAKSSTTQLTYSATLPSGVAPGDSFTNSVSVPSYTSTTNVGTTFLYSPSPAPAATATVTVPNATITKTAPTTITIGQSGTFTITARVPAHTTLYSSKLADTVPNNWAVDAATATVNGTATAVSTTGNAVSVTLGTLDNSASASAAVVVLTITAHLLDSSGNVRGTSTTNTGTLTWTGTSTSTQRTVTASAASTVVEPLLTLAKTDDAGGKATPGSTVTYKVTATNSSAANVSTAYDTVITDLVPTDVTPQKVGGGDAADGDTVAGTGAGVWNAAARTVTFPAVDIAKGANSAPTIVVKVNDPLTSSGSIVNQASVTTTSLSGPVTGERTAASSQHTGYTAAANDTLSNPTIGLTKSASPSTATVGDDVTYTLTMTVPASTVADHVTIVDTLPAGITWRGVTSTSCSDGSATPCALVPTTYQGGSNQVAYYFGNVSSSTSARTVTVVYTGRLNSSATPGALVNSARVKFDTPGSSTFAPTSFADISGHAYTTTLAPVTATVTDLEPSLTITKAVTNTGQNGHLGTTPPRAKAGATVTYTVTVTNATGATIGSAYTVGVQDALPTGISCAAVAAGSATCSGSNPAVLRWVIAGPLAAGQSQSFVYAITAPDMATATALYGAQTSPELVNTASIPVYYGAANGPSDTTRYRQYAGPSASASVQLDLASISGNITEDWDLSGSKTAADAPLANIPVTVTYLGADNTYGTSDDETFSTTTDASGNYSVSNLTGGTYRVTVDPTTIANRGLTGSWDADGAPLGVWSTTVAENSTTTGVDFGYRGTSSIGDTVYFDHSADGTQQTGEPGIPGATVTLTASDGRTRTATTDGNGSYSFGSLPAGTYTVTATTPTGYATATTATSKTITIGAGGTDLTADFGFTGGLSLGNTVWLDRDSDGTQGSGEPGIPNVLVTVTYQPAGANQAAVFTTRTDQDGHYSVGTLPAGPYTVAVSTSTLPAGATATYDLDGVLTPNTTAVTLSTTGGNRIDVNFGYDATRSLGGTVWWDYTGDHNPASGPGLGGVTLDVVYYGPDGVPGGGDDIAYTATTNADGTWALQNVSQGNYGVSVRSAPAGFSATFDTDGTANGLGATRVTVPATGTTPPQDFGYAGTGSIGDLVFLDRNGDGAQSATAGREPGLGGVAVTLTTTVGAQTLTLSTTTNASGAYTFPGLPAGTHTVAITVPTGFVAVSDLDGGDHATASVPLTTGQARTDADVGLAGTASLSGTVYNDRDGDNTPDADEPGLPGVTLTASGVTSTGTITLTTVTAADGSWSFGALPTGTWTVRPTAGIPAGYSEVSESDGTPNGSIATTLTTGQSASGQLFGYRGAGSIGDTVYLDQNGSHSAAGQPGVPNQRVDLLWAGPDGDLSTTGDNESWTTTTDSAGGYLIRYLPQGVFRVTVVGGITASAANTGDPDGGADNTSRVTLTAQSPSDLNQDFGYAATSTTGSNALGDLVWWDQDGDGVHDATEPGIPGATVTARWFGPDGVANTADDIVLTTTTSGTGAYGFTGLPDGRYTVTVTAGVYSGLVPSLDTADAAGSTADGASTVTLTGGVANTGVDFGYVGTGSIGDHVYLDEDGDGTQDAGEPGIPGATATVVWAGPDAVFGTADDVTFTDTTGDAGAWLAPRLPAGSFTVAITGVPSGLANTGDPDGGADSRSALTLAAGQDDLDQDFGYQGSASLGDTVYLDVTSDGEQTGNEPGLSGVTVTVRSAGADGILDTADDIVATRTTDASGGYSAVGLPVGAVRVSYDPTTLPKGDVPSKDLDGGASASSTELVLAAGDARTDVDFAAIGTGRVAGVVYNDRNGDGKRQARETGVAGVQIVVTWNGPNGAVLSTATTAADGSWSVSNLPAGSYTVAIVTTSLARGFRPSSVASLAITLDPGASASAAFGISRAGLASTGLDVLRGIGVAVLLLAMGATLLIVRRRRRAV